MRGIIFLLNTIKQVLGEDNRHIVPKARLQLRLELFFPLHQHDLLQTNLSIGVVVLTAVQLVLYEEEQWLLFVLLVGFVPSPGSVGNALDDSSCAIEEKGGSSTSNGLIIVRGGANFFGNFQDVLHSRRGHLSDDLGGIILFTVRFSHNPINGVAGSWRRSRGSLLLRWYSSLALSTGRTSRGGCRHVLR